MSKTKEERQTLIDLIGGVPVAIAFAIAGWIDEEIEEQKRKEAMAVLQWLSSARCPLAILYGDEPERYTDGRKDYTSEQVYDLYLQSLTPKISTK